jgi:hypothetical protein
MKFVLLQGMSMKLVILNSSMKLSDLISESTYQGGLRKWFRQDWRDISRKKDGVHPPCGDSAGSKSRGSDGQRAYPKCVPAAVANKMTPKQKKSASTRKRRVERKPSSAGQANRVSTKPG